MMDVVVDIAMFVIIGLAILIAVMAILLFIFLTIEGELDRATKCG